MTVVFVDTVHPILSQRLKERNFKCIHLENESEEACKKALKTADGLVIRSRFPIDKEFLNQTPKLKFIARSGAGLENIDLEECENKNVQVYNSPEGNRNAVGEHCLGMLLSILNKMHVGHNEVCQSIWRREENRGEELDGKTVGIIGFGNNGSAFAKKLRGFDVKVLAYDKYKTGYGDHFVIESTLESIFENADVISFHIPQNKETHYFFNDAFVDFCKKPFYLLNASRGKIVQLSALQKAIDEKKVLAAGLDVLEIESSSFENFENSDQNKTFQKLIDSNKVLFTPHVA
ncbi:MAG: D-3-phosphoglycerate dehydrogenase, partial [Lentimonas sp.]